MHTNITVRKIAKSIVVAYSKHIKAKIAERDELYISLGVDNTFKEYETLFQEIIGRVLGRPLQTRVILPNQVLIECIDVVDSALRQKGYTQIIENPRISECVYDVCMHILKTIEDEEFTTAVTITSYN